MSLAACVLASAAVTLNACVPRDPIVTAADATMTGDWLIERPGGSPDRQDGAKSRLLRPQQFAFQSTFRQARLARASPTSRSSPQCR